MPEMLANWSGPSGWKNAMKLFEKFFRPRPPIRDREALADFIDAQSAFIVQKGIYEYSRARAGHYAKVLFAEKGSQSRSNMRAGRRFRSALSMVGEMVDVVLRPHAGENRRAMLDQDHRSRAFGFRPLSGAAVDRRGCLAGGAARTRSTGSTWSGGMRRKRVMDIPEAAGGELLCHDADPRKAARAGFPDHAQLPSCQPVQHS